MTIGFECGWFAFACGRDLWMRELAAQTGPVGEKVVRELHRRIVAGGEPDSAGIYRSLPY